MTGREKIQAALGPEGSPEFAAVTCYQSIFLRDHWEQATGAPWWAQHDPEPERAAQPWLDMVRRTGEDWFQVRYGATRQTREDTTIEADGEAAWQVNRRTGERVALHRPPVGGDQPAPQAGQTSPGAAVRTPEALEAALEAVYGPCPGDFAASEDGSLDLAQVLVAELGDSRMPIAHAPSPWWYCNSLWSFSELMERMIETPELVTLACERLLTHSLHLVQRSAAAGAGLIWIEDCMSDMISPRQCRDFSLAYVRPLVEAIREAGMLSVHYYCGRPDDRWDFLLDTGADALALEEGKKGFAVDLLALAERLDGRMALLGNIDAIAVMEHGSEAALRAEVARQIEIGRRNCGRFVCSIGSPVTPGTPLRRVRRYTDLAHEATA
ncbi:MAG: uroporphyrinogen decarboxylase family protein [Armatimonadota bacterium]